MGLNLKRNIFKWGWRRKILIIIVIFVLFISCVTIALIINNKNIIKEAEKLNSCYMVAEKIVEDGYNRDEADKLIIMTKQILDKEITESVFKKSRFYTNNYTITFGGTPDIREKIQGEDKATDVLTAIYLVSVLSEKPDEFQQNFLNYYPDVTLWLITLSEFDFLLLNYFNPTEGEISVVLKSYEVLAENCENPVSKYNAYRTESYLIREYNEMTGSNLTMSSKAKEEYLKVADYVKDYTDEVFIWHGYDYQQDNQGMDD